MSQQDQKETVQTPASASAFVRFVVGVGSAARRPIHGVTAGFMLLAFVVTLVFGIAVGKLSVLNDGPTLAAPTTINNTTINNTVAASTSVPTPSVVSAPKSEWTSPIKQVAGKTYIVHGTPESYGLAYECESGLTPVELSPGQTIRTDGSIFTLTERKKSWTSDQGELTLSVQLNATTAVRGIVVTPAAHVKHPDLYNEYNFGADFGFGTAATQVFQPMAYSQNYTGLGINSLTLCTERK